jgi:hypothetical protein
MWDFEVPVILLVSWQCGNNIVGLVHIQSLFSDYLGLFPPKLSGRNMKMASHLRVEPRFRRVELISTPPYAFMALS